MFNVGGAIGVGSPTGSDMSLPSADSMLSVSIKRSRRSPLKTKAIPSLIFGLVIVALICSIANIKGSDIPRHVSSVIKEYSTRGRPQRELLMVKESLESSEEYEASLSGESRCRHEQSSQTDAGTRRIICIGFLMCGFAVYFSTFIVLFLTGKL